MSAELLGSGSVFLTGLALSRADATGALQRGLDTDLASICSEDFITACPVADAEVPWGAATTSASLVPFVCPPPTAKLSLKHRYFSSALSEASSAHGITEWEKNAILARLQKVEPLDTLEYERRLGNMHARNTDTHINAVRRRVRHTRGCTELGRAEAFVGEQERRDLIFFRHRNLLQLRKMEKFMARAQMWYNVIVGHVFITAIIQERKVLEALDTFAHLLAPMARRFVTLRRKRLEAAELTRAQMRDIPFPHPPVIQSMYGTFFANWPPVLLEKLVANATPTYLGKGSFLMHEGDIGRVMYMITTGTVSIILHKKGMSKRRSKDNSSGVLEITAPCYVGEFALVCKEPRSASIYCETDIGYWAVRPEDYEDVARHLSADVASKQREATDVRRRQNLKKFFPLKVGLLRKFPYFELFSTASLEKVIDLVEPLVLHDGDYLFRRGEMDSSVYFVQDGSAVRRDADGGETMVPTGSCVGMFECSCGVNERKQTSIVSMRYCDVWRMTRDALTDIGMSEPVALLHCRKSAKADRALEVRRDPKAPLFLRNDPFLAFCLPTAYINKLYQMCEPVVYLNGEKITIMGQPVNNIVILLTGAVDMTVASAGEQETFRLDVSEGRDHRIAPDPPAPLPQQKESTSPRALSGGSAPDGKATQPPGSVSQRRSTPAAGARMGRAGLPSALASVEPEASRRPSASCAATLVLGAYEMASSVKQYPYTISSFGLTEALYVDKAKFDAVLPPDLRSILHNNLKARDIAVKAYKTKALGLLQEESSCSFVAAYRELREAGEKRAKAPM